jgi:hypothetical protein
MNDEDPRCTCLEYIPGEIIVIRWRSEESEIVGSRFELGEVVESIPLDPISPRYRVIERIAVPVGLELRYIRIISRQESTISESLNYIGEWNSATRSVSVNGHNGTYISALADGSYPQSFVVPSLDLERPLLVAVDVEEAHCRQVLAAASASAKKYGGSAARLIGLYRQASSTTVGLYEYLGLIAELNKFEQCPDAITMSVDFGLACLRRGSGVRDSNPVTGMASVASYSFPVFEASLSIILGNCRNKPSHFGRFSGETDAPAVFAAAGNRMSKSGPTLRLAYPALRPEIIAVTHAEGDTNQGFGPSKTSDLPLGYDLKPVFAVSEPMAQQAKAPVGGTSFAAPWAASWYLCERSKIGPNRELQALFSGPLARVATLQQLSERVRFKHSVGQQVTLSPIQLLPSVVGLPHRDPHWVLGLAADLIDRLNREFSGFEFGLTGSAVALMTSAGKSDLVVSVRPSDIDLIYYSANPPSAEIANRISARASQFFSPLFHVKEGIPVELSSIDGRIAPLALLQCIIPVTSMVLTSSGLIDAWGGRDDINAGTIRCIQPLVNEKFKNPQATAEQFARFPSFLVGLTVAFRLWTQWAYRSDGEQNRPCPDLEVSLSDGIRDVLKVEPPAIWTSRTRQRIGKLAKALRETSTAVAQHPGMIQPKNLGESIATLVKVTSASYEQNSSAPAWLSTLFDETAKLTQQLKSL